MTSEVNPVRNWCGVSAWSAAGRAHGAAASVTGIGVAGGGGVRRSIPLSVCLSVCLSVHLSIHLSVHLSVSLSACGVAVYDGAEGRLIPRVKVRDRVRVRVRVRAKGNDWGLG